MNKNRSACSTLLPFVACISPLAQERIEAPLDSNHGRYRELAATQPDLRLEPIASRVTKGKLYSLAPLADGRILAFDRNDHKPVYVVTRTPAISGSYTLAFNGSVLVKDGVVIDLSGANVQSTAHTLSLDRRGKLVVKWRVRLPAGAGRPLGAKLSMIDLKDGRLMLLEGNEIYQVKHRLAPDGEYRLPRTGSLSVKQGGVARLNDDPDYDYPEDFAP